MFEMPQGEIIEEEIDLSASATEFPFEFGCISSYRPRARSPCAHRLIAAGHAVGWLSEAEENRCYISGAAGKSRLIELADAHDLRHRVTVWNVSQFVTLVNLVPESLTDPSLLTTLGSGDGGLLVNARDMPLVVDALAEQQSVRGAIAFEDGIVVHNEGLLPAEPDVIATAVQKHLAATDNLTESIEGEPSPWISMRLGDGLLSILRDGASGIAMWAEAGADARALLTNASSIIEPSIGELEDDDGEPLPEGFVVRDGRGGVDGVISLLRTALDSRLVGHLQSVKKSGEIISLVLVDGMPVGLRTSGSIDLETAVHDFTTPSSHLHLHRLQRSARLLMTGGNVEGWSLAGFSDAVASVRTRSENRLELLRQRLDTLYRFELGLETVRAGKSDWTMLEIDAPGISKIMPSESGRKVLRPENREVRDRLQRLEGTRVDLEREKGRLERLLTEAQESRDESKESNVELVELLDSARERVVQLSEELDLAGENERRSTAEASDSKQRADRLTRRIAELEHQVERRVEEIASALGEMDSRTELLRDLERLTTEEGVVKTELADASARLDSIRTSLDEDERVQRVLNDQVTALRERHRLASTEAGEVSRRVESERLELAALEGESHAMRRLLEEERGRLAGQDQRQSLLQSELRELMAERRTIMRELGDLDARRAQSEADLRSLVDEAELLQSAHEQALVDIAEANRIRARLQEEPLARALLDDDDGLRALEPVLDRMDRARARDCSMVLLDRAVERGLAVIQHTVDEVARTPRHLLSTEVMDLLASQAPETASAVRGLTRWSVQQRLQHTLGQTVHNVVIDLEDILDGYEMSLTLLGQLQEVLRSLSELGIPTERIARLERLIDKPEALPHLSVEIRRLIRSALDEVYIDADLRDAGQAVDLAGTVEVLERLDRRLLAMDDSDGRLQGAIWTFQASGSLPFEEVKMAGMERPDVEQRTLREMDPLSVEAARAAAVTAYSTGEISDAITTVRASETDSELTDTTNLEKSSDETTSQHSVDDTWQPMEEPGETSGVDSSSRSTYGLVPASAISGSDETAKITSIDETINKIDNAKRGRDNTRHGVPDPANPEERDALSAIEDELADLDL
jgi:hypothetical protein